MAQTTTSDARSTATYAYWWPADFCWQSKLVGPLVRGLHQDASTVHLFER